MKPFGLEFEYYDRDMVEGHREFFDFEIDGIFDNFKAQKPEEFERVKNELVLAGKKITPSILMQSLTIQKMHYDGIHMTPIQLEYIDDEIIEDDEIPEFEKEMNHEHAKNVITKDYEDYVGKEIWNSKVGEVQYTPGTQKRRKHLNERGFNITHDEALYYVGEVGIIFNHVTNEYRDIPSYEILAAQYTEREIAYLLTEDDYAPINLRAIITTDEDLLEYFQEFTKGVYTVPFLE